MSKEREMKQQGGAMKIVNINSNLKAILDLLGSSKLYNGDDDNEEESL